MKKVFLFLFAFLLLLAYVSKPDYKTCVIETVTGIWGSYTPDVKKFPQYYEQFMDLHSKNVHIDDWIFLKRIRYQYGQEKKTVALGLFKRVVFI